MKFIVAARAMAARHTHETHARPACRKKALTFRLEQLQDIFARLDRDKSGTTDAEEFRHAIRSLRLPGWYDGSAPDAAFDALVNDLFAEFDYDGSGEITYSEYIKFTIREALTRSTTRVLSLFKLWDADSSGAIDKVYAHTHTHTDVASTED